VALLLTHGLVRRVRTLEVSVRPLGGDFFKVRLDCSKPTVAETKSEIARVQGTKETLQQLYRVVVRADSEPVREEEAEAEPLNDNCMVLAEGAIVTMAVKEPLLWRTFASDRLKLSEGGMVATQTSTDHSLTTTGMGITAGRHYWEVEIVRGGFYVGVSRPDLDPKATSYTKDNIDGCFMSTFNGTLWGNGKWNDEEAGYYNNGDRVGVLLDLNDGSILFFKNGIQHGPGYPAGSVTGPMAPAVHIRREGPSAKLIGGAEWPAGHAEQ
jgi:hypothetical protein